MDNKYINIYNNLVNLTRNKNLYEEFTKEDKFSDRLIILLFHFAFFLNVFKSDSIKNTLQEIFDYFFRQLELSIREIGYGDAVVNKKMKNYINILYTILNKIENWDKFNKDQQNQVFCEYLNLKKNTPKLTKYFNNYRDYLRNNTFNSLLKGVIKLNF